MDGRRVLLEDDNEIDRLERDGVIIGLETRWSRRDGTILYIRESARTVRDADGSVRYYEGTVEDITQRRDAEVALAQREKELQDAHTRLLAYQAAIARGELVSIPLEPAPAAEPPPPPPPAAPTPEPAIHVNGTNGAARPAPGVAKARPPRMAPPTLPGTG